MSDNAPTKKPTWHEKELANALQRLANARANLATLEEQAGGGNGGSLRNADPADIDRIEELEAELAKLRPKANSRFGGGAARDRIEELEFQQRLVFERVGVATYDELVAAKAAPVTSTVDPDVLAFAVRECEQAEEAFLEIASMQIPENEPEEELDLDGDGQADAEIIDLNVKPAAS